jgi:hypothetical protein
MASARQLGFRFRVDPTRGTAQAAAGRRRTTCRLLGARRNSPKRSRRPATITRWRDLHGFDRLASIRRGARADRRRSRSGGAARGAPPAGGADRWLGRGRLARAAGQPALPLAQAGPSCAHSCCSKAAAACSTVRTGDRPLDNPSGPAGAAGGESARSTCSGLLRPARWQPGANLPRCSGDRRADAAGDRCPAGTAPPAGYRG